MPDLTPLILDPVLVPKPWGGRSLARFGKHVPDGVRIGESWEVADLPQRAVTSAEQSRTRIADGDRRGETLREVIARLGSDLLGTAEATPDGDFPLLVKYLDAAEDLSVQVHPTADYVADHPGTHLKSESWYIVDAEPGSVIYKDVRPGVTLEDVQAVVGTSALVELLQPVAAQPGAFHHMPAGIVHALGAGVVVAEPQTPSDTTFRLYDWTDEYGREPRQLHLVEALETMVLDPPHAIAHPPMDAAGDRPLIATEHYWMHEHRTTGGAVALRPDAELRVLMVLDGDAVASSPGSRSTNLPIGTTAVIPAAIASDVELATSDHATILEIGLI